MLTVNTVILAARGGKVSEVDGNINVHSWGSCCSKTPEDDWIHVVLTFSRIQTNNALVALNH